MPDDNPFMAGAVHGQDEADAVVNIGVSGPGVVTRALQRLIADTGPATSRWPTSPRRSRSRPSASPGSVS